MKIIKPATKVIYCRLQEVLDIVHAKRPLLEYHHERDNIANEVTCVTVWQDGQQVGKIDANFRRYSPSKGTNEMWFAITSDNIRKERGSSRNTKFAKDAKTAAKIAIETFTKKELSKLGVDLISDVKSFVESAHGNVAYAYNNAVNLPRPILIKYFSEIHKGYNPPAPKAIVDQFVNQEVTRKIENMDIADNVLRHAKANNGYALRLMKDETILCAPLNNAEATIKYASTYDMPVYLQEKFTMLKLLENGQFAADIGIKYDRDNGSSKDTRYFIVGGETKVM